MQDWVSLKTVLEQNPKFSRHFIDYVPDENWTTSQTCENGYDWQYFETEYNLGGYHAFLYEGEIYLISAYATKTTLIIRGEEAYEGMLSSIAKIHSIYGCQKMQALGKPLTSRILEKMPQFLSTIYKRPYWIYERVTPFPTEPERKLMKHVVDRGNIITQKILNTDSNNAEVKRAYAIRPLILLSPNTYIDIGNEKRQGDFENQAFPIALNK